MRNNRFISILGIWILVTARGLSQMSTFPTPPSLTPPSDGAVANGLGVPNSSDSSSATQPSTGNSGKPSPTDSTATPAPASPITAATLNSMEALDDKVALEAGDSVSLRVIEDKDKAVPRIVTDTGEIDFPYIGRIKVEGKTCHQVAVEAKKLLEVDYYKHATVIVGLDLIIGQEDKTKPHDMVWVVGEVRQVGPQELLKNQPMTVSQVILRAGGFGDFADQRKIRVIHRTIGSSDEPPDLSNPKDSQVIDVKSVYDGHSNVDPVLKPNDYIIVPKRFFNY